MSIAKLNARRKEAGLPLIRFALRRLLPEDLQDLRDAFAAMYEISAAAAGDRRGYWALARGHGYDEDLCHNDDRVFLTWHRAYIYAFEKALNTALRWKRQDQTLELTLPFWDWTLTDPTVDAANGIPRALDDRTYADPAGVQQPNPLASARSMYREVSQGLPPGQLSTERFPRRFLAGIPRLANEVARYLTNPDFVDFSRDFNGGAHGAVHVWVGGQNPASPLPNFLGDMGSAASAAYDPMFWLHHAMVDKVWFDWQTQHGDSTVPEHVRDTVVYGDFRGEEVLDAERSLRYVYSDEEVEAAEEVGGTAPDTAASGAPSSPPHALVAPPMPGSSMNPTLRIGLVKGPFRRAQLDFHQLRPPKSSFEIRAFINNPNATDNTLLDDPSYAGRLVLFGHGECFGTKGHCNPALAMRDDYDLREKHPLRFEHTRYVLDVTRGLRRALASSGGPRLIEVTLVTVGADGSAVPQNSVRYRGVSLFTR